MAGACVPIFCRNRHVTSGNTVFAAAPRHDEKVLAFYKRVNRSSHSLHKLQGVLIHIS